MDIAAPAALPRRRIGIAAGAAGLAVFLILNAFWFGVGVHVSAICNVRGSGASCFFTQAGALPGSQCFVIHLDRNEDGASIASQRVCSGFLMPRATVNVEASAVFMTDPVAHCSAERAERVSTWTERCTMRVTRE